METGGRPFCAEYDQHRGITPCVFFAALLRLVDSVTSAKMIQPVFLDSYMSDICSDIAVSEGSVRRFISKLGQIQGQIDAFMKAQVMPGTTLLFDGTSIFSRSADSLSAKGYNPEHSQNPQARIEAGCRGIAQVLKTKRTAINILRIRAARLP